MDETYQMSFSTILLSKLKNIGSVFAAGKSWSAPSHGERAVDKVKENISTELDRCSPPRTDGTPKEYSNQGNKYASSGDRGKSGAGVTGSRTSRNSENSNNVPDSATNPGLLRHLHNAARYRMPQCFEGGCLQVVKGNSSGNWMFGHTMNFSSVSPGGYKFMISYADKSKLSTLPYFVMEAAPSGQMSCEMRVSPTRSTRATIVTQIAKAELYSLETTFDAYFKKSTASVIAVNREFVAVHFLQALTNAISFGAEVVTRGQSNEVSSVSGAARCANDLNSFSATVGNRGLDICFTRVVRPYLTLAAMFEVGFTTSKSIATVAYEWTADTWTVRGSADSDGLVGATLEKALGGKHAQLSYAISALLNHPNDKFRLGFGINAAIV